MKTLVAAATAHLGQQVTSLATCWKITRLDGVVLGFTDYHEDLVRAGITYKAQSGMVRASTLTGTADLGVDNTDIETVLDSAAIDREDVLAGKYDYAELRIFLVNYLDPGAWEIKLSRGRLGEVSVGQLAGRVELRSLTQLLKQRVGRTHEVACPYELGESKCGVALASFTVTGTVTDLFSQHRFSDINRALTQEDHWFRGGKLTWTSGPNAGLAMEVKDYFDDIGDFRLSLDMPFPIQIGNGYSVYAGCDKKYATCQAKFNNQNFGGFPHIPGTDFAYSFPDSRGS